MKLEAPPITVARLAPARSARPRPRTRPAFDRDYWLAHCEGFRVDAEGGRIGFVDEVRPSARGPVLAVRAGLLGRRLLLVPADQVAFVVPRAERLWLRSPLTLVGTEPARA